MRVFPWPIAIILAGLAIVIFVLYQDKDFKGSITPHQPRAEDQADIEELLSQLEIDKSSLIEVTCFNNETKKEKYQILHVLRIDADFLFKEAMIVVEGLNCSKKQFKRASEKISEIVKSVIKAETGRITSENGKWKRIIRIQQQELNLEECRKIFNEYVKYFYGFYWSYEVLGRIQEPLFYFSEIFGKIKSYATY